MGDSFGGGTAVALSYTLQADSDIPVQFLALLDPVCRNLNEAPFNDTPGNFYHASVNNEITPSDYPYSYFTLPPTVKTADLWFNDAYDEKQAASPRRL